MTIEPNSEVPEPDHYHGCEFCSGATYGGTEMEGNATVIHEDDCPVVDIRTGIAVMEGIEEEPEDIEDEDWDEEDPE